MLTKNKKNSFGLFKYLLLIPVLGGLLWVSACTDEADSKIIQNQTEQVDSKSTIEINPLGTETAQEEGDGDIFVVVEEMPVFDGEGLQKFQNWVQQNVNYPDIAIEYGIKGTVFVNFIIDKDGDVSSIKIIRGVDPSLDNEVKRVMESAPSWTPGKQKGQTVKVKMSIPVKFTLE